MEQRDYILREIEKIGTILSAIWQKIFGGKDNPAISPEKQIENARGMLLNETDFDLDKFLELNIENSNEYICSFNGFNVENIELLAGCIFQIGLNDNDSSKKYLEKALQLYNLCNIKSKTYSFEREANIQVIKNKIYIINVN